MSEDSKYAVRAVLDEALNLFELKNQDYGDSWREQGWRGNLSRILEKAGRLRKVWRKGSYVVPDEGLRETALDMINTLAFLVINHDTGREWGHEETLPVISMTDEQAQQFVHERSYEHWRASTSGQTILPMVPSATYDHGDPGQDTAFVNLTAEQTRNAIDPPATVPTKKPRPRKATAVEPDDEPGPFAESGSQTGS